MLVLCGSECQGFVLPCFIASVCLQLLLAVRACLAAPRWNSSCRGEGPFSPGGSWNPPVGHFLGSCAVVYEHRGAFSYPQKSTGQQEPCLVLGGLPGGVQCLNAAPLLPGISSAPLQLDQFFAKVQKLHITFWNFSSFFLQDWIIGNKVRCKSLH